MNVQKLKVICVNKKNPDKIKLENNINMTFKHTFTS